MIASYQVKKRKSLLTHFRVTSKGENKKSCLSFTNLSFFLFFFFPFCPPFSSFTCTRHLSTLVKNILDSTLNLSSIIHRLYVKTFHGDDLCKLIRLGNESLGIWYENHNLKTCYLKQNTNGTKYFKDIIIE